MNKKYFHNLCEKAVTGNLEESEKIHLNDWLAESELNRTEFDKLKKIWSYTEPRETPQIPDIDMEWNQLNKKLESLEIRHKIKMPDYSETKYYIKSFLLPKFKPALIIVIIFICIITGFYILNRETPNQQLINITTANKEHQKILLPDGSIIFLNSGSNIKYSNPFNKNSRDMYLKGEAFFEVTKNSIPFNIFSFNAKVSVLGTQFDVWARDGKTRVIVKEGRVKLARLNSAFKSVNLSANQTSSIIEDSTPSFPKEIDSHYLLGWMKGKLVFDRTPLNEVIEELERTYNIKIALESGTLSKNTITGSFNNYSIDTVLSMVCLALNLRYEQQPGSYLIKSKDIKN